MPSLGEPGAVRRNVPISVEALLTSAD